MTDAHLLLAAIVVFTMLVIGLVLTVLEFTKLQRDADADADTKNFEKNNQDRLR
jgi:hypothetical protein